VGPITAMSSRNWPWFVGWFVVGLAGSMVIVASFTWLGLLAVPLAAGGAVLLLRFDPAHRGIEGLMSGLSAPFGFVAYQNRKGPGQHCWTSRDGLSSGCEELFNPWPWLLVAVLALSAGVAITYYRHRHIGVVNNPGVSQDS
jgi:hypothetical protein